MKEDEAAHVADRLVEYVWQGDEARRGLAEHCARVAVAAMWEWGDGPGATGVAMSTLRSEGLDPGDVGRRAGAQAVRAVRLAAHRGPVPDRAPGLIPEQQAWHVRGILVTHWGPQHEGEGILRVTPHGRRLRCGQIININWIPGYGGPECDHCVRFGE